MDHTTENTLQRALKLFPFEMSTHWQPDGWLTEVLFNAESLGMSTIKKDDRVAIQRFLTVVAFAYGKPVRDQCEQCIRQLPEDKEIDTGKVLLEARREQDECLEEAVAASRDVPFYSRIRLK